MITIVKLSARRYLAVDVPEVGGWRNTQVKPDVDPETNQPLGYRYTTGEIIAGPAPYDVVDREAYAFEQKRKRTLTYLDWKREGANQ